jgi:peptidoglycan/LPS O-acetylase OafA/YrhL
MLWLILALVVCVALASAVLGMVAVPARREGRQVLTPRGENLVTSVAQTTDKVATRAKGATENVVGSVKRERSGA